jgi:ferredoxin
MIKMLRYKITINQRKCIGCGGCVIACSNFKIQDKKAIPKKEIVARLGCNQEAADVCPVSAIRVRKVMG